MSKNILLLLNPGFQRPDHPADALFACPQCNALEGLLAAQPLLASTLDVRRVAFPRPRAHVVDLLGEDNQGLPALVLAEDAPQPPHVSHYQGQAFLQGASDIAAYLAEYHGAYRLS